MFLSFSFYPKDFNCGEIIGFNVLVFHSDGSPSSFPLFTIPIISPTLFVNSISMLYSVQAFSGETHNHKQSESTNHKRHEDDEDRHTQTVYYGLMALMGIIGFLAIERILTIVSDLCSKSNRKTTKVIPEIPVLLSTHIPDVNQMECV